MALTRRILLLEADTMARNNFVRTLDGQGFDVDVAANLAHAAEQAERVAYAVIVVDDELRRSSMADPLLRLGELQPGAVRMLVATERSFVRVAEAVNDRGVQGVLTKPWSRESLVPALERGLRLYHQGHGQRLAVASLEQAFAAAGAHRQVLDEAVQLVTTWVDRHAAGDEPLDAEAAERLRELQGRFGRTGRRVFSHLGDLSTLLQPAPERQIAAATGGAEQAAGQAAEPAADQDPADQKDSLEALLDDPAPAPTPADRRQHPRVPLSVEVMLRDAEKMWTGTSEDISVGGTLVRTARPSERGDVVAIEFRLPGSDSAVRCQARVTWVRRSEGPSGHGTEAGIGLQFLGLPEAAAAAIDGFVSRWDDDVLEHLELLAR